MGPQRFRPRLGAGPCPTDVQNAADHYALPQRCSVLQGVRHGYRESHFSSCHLEGFLAGAVFLLLPVLLVQQVEGWLRGKGRGGTGTGNSDLASGLERCPRVALSQGPSAPVIVSSEGLCYTESVAQQRPILSNWELGAGDEWKNGGATVRQRRAISLAQG
jgi:hypothetical protein